MINSPKHKEEIQETNIPSQREPETPLLKIHKLEGSDFREFYVMENTTAGGDYWSTWTSRDESIEKVDRNG